MTLLEHREQEEYYLNNFKDIGIFFLLQDRNALHFRSHKQRLIDYERQLLTEQSLQTKAFPVLIRQLFNRE